jgi:hypothetical protein
VGGNERTVTIRFYMGAKRHRSTPPWPGGIVPVDRLVDGLKQLDRGVRGNDEYEWAGKVVIGHVRDETEDYAHLVFHRIRQDNLPSMRRGATGEIEDLDLDEDDALAEPTEMLFFKNGVIAHAVNRDGPGSLLAARYLEDKTDVDIVMVPLLRPDALSQLREDDEVQAVTMKVASGDWHQLEDEADTHGLRDLARGMVAAPGTGSIELIFRPERGQRDEFWRTWRPRLLRVAASRWAEKLKVRRSESDDRAEMVDLLEAKLAVSTPVAVQQRSRRLVPRAAERAMVMAYNHDQHQILAAVRELQGLTYQDDANDGH